MSCSITSLTTMVIFCALGLLAIGWAYLELAIYKRDTERRYLKLWEECAQARTELTMLRPYTELVKVQGGWVRRFKGEQS